MKSRFPIVDLGKHVRHVSQRNRSGADIEVFSVTNSEGFTRSTDYFSKEVFSKDVTNYKIVNFGQFAYNPSRINVGSIDYLRHNSPVLVSPLYVVFECDSNVHADYLLRYLRSTWGNAEIRTNTEGAVRDSLKYKGLEKVKIPLPMPDEQKRISNLLGKVERQIAQRNQHLQQLDDLLKSIFLEMFGDPISNPQKFPVRKLSEFYINPKEGTKCGPFGSALKKEELVDWGIPVWNMDNIDPAGRMVLPFRMWVTELKYKELVSYSVIDGDIIISRAGTVGKMCVAQMMGEPAIISTNLIRLRLGKKLRPLYVVSLMTYCKGRVGRLKTGADGAFTHMTTGILDKLEFPYPPIELQDQFAAVVEKVKSLRSYYKQSLAGLEALYCALSQAAFKGELDLTRVPLPLQATTYDPESSELLNRMAHERHKMKKEVDLPAPADFAALHSVEGRTKMLSEWLTVWVEQLGDAPFVAQTFMDAARQRLWEVTEEEATDWGVSEYDELKAWVFEQIAQGKMKQIRNFVCVNEKRHFGNEVVLRVRKARV